MSQIYFTSPYVTQYVNVKQARVTVENLLIQVRKEKNQVMPTFTEKQKRNPFTLIKPFVIRRLPMVRALEKKENKYLDVLCDLEIKLIEIENDAKIYFDMKRLDKTFTMDFENKMLEDLNKEVEMKKVKWVLSNERMREYTLVTL
jgi:hypothetical protein